MCQQNIFLSEDTLILDTDVVNTLPTTPIPPNTLPPVRTNTKEKAARRTSADSSAVRE
jgi:hypothetical protein